MHNDIHSPLLITPVNDESPLLEYLLKVNNAFLQCKTDVSIESKWTFLSVEVFKKFIGNRSQLQTRLIIICDSCYGI